jgi:hypothetical protein
MGVLAIPLAMMGMALVFALPMGSQAGTRSILREKVDARGRVGDDLALPFFGASIPGFVGLLTGRGPFSPAFALIPGRSDDLAAKTGWRMARGFRWQILLPDAAGRFQPARPDQIFRTGQALRLCIEPQCDSGSTSLIATRRAVRWSSCRRGARRTC